MNKKQLIVAFLTFLICLPLYGAEIPQELKDLGFTQYTLIHYRFEGRIEYFTFSDRTTEQRGDTITFMVQDGEVKEILKGFDYRIKQDKEI